MPTYSWKCRDCGRTFETQMSIREKEEWEPRCMHCGSSRLEQQLLGFSVGSGVGTPSPGG